MFETERFVNVCDKMRKDFKQHKK